MLKHSLSLEPFQAEKRQSEKEEEWVRRRKTREMSGVLSLHAVVENRYIQLYHLSKNCNGGEWAYSNCGMLGDRVL